MSFVVFTSRFLSIMSQDIQTPTIILTAMSQENLRFESLWVVRCDVYTSTDRGGGLSYREGIKKMGLLFRQWLTVLVLRSAGK